MCAAIKLHGAVGGEEGWIMPNLEEFGSIATLDWRGSDEAPDAINYMFKLYKEKLKFEDVIDEEELCFPIDYYLDVVSYKLKRYGYSLLSLPFGGDGYRIALLKTEDYEPIKKDLRVRLDVKDYFLEIPSH